MTPRVRRRLAVLALAAGVLALASGCGVKGSLAPNLAPETSVFVQGDLDTVSHTVHLFWSGTDRDGTVKGFEWRMFNAQQPADTQWTFTANTDSVFVVWDTIGVVTPRFEVRAVDDRDLRDPDPARQVFRFSNRAPSVQLVSRPTFAETTFASVTVTWQAADLDGDPSRLRFRVWLDGQQSDPIFTSGRSLTMPSARFGTTGAYASGYRKLYIQAIDDGGRTGNVDSTTWFVRAPVTGSRARLLIVDDVPSSNTADFRIDTLYSNTAARNLSPGEYTILRIRTTQPFRSTADLEQTLALFEAVVWYRGNELGISTVLRDYQDAITTYVRSGGKFYVDGLYLIAGLNANGALRESFLTDVLRAQRMAYNFVAVNDSSAGFGNANPSVFRSDVFADSVRQQTLPARTLEAGGVRWFQGADPSTVALYAPVGSLSPPNGELAPVGLSVPQPGGGRCMVLTIPLGTSTLFPGSPAFNAAPRMLAKIFQHLGLTGP